jgi:hypothetical protein
MKNALFKLCLVVCLLAGIGLVVGGILLLGFILLYSSIPDNQGVSGGDEFVGIVFSAVLLGSLMWYLPWLLLRSEKSGQLPAQSSLKHCQHCHLPVVGNPETCRWCGADL